MLFLPLSAIAQPEHFTGHSRKCSSVPEELDLTVEQKAKIAEMHKESKAERKNHIQKKKRLRKKTRDEFLKANTSVTRLSELAGEAGELERAYTDKRNRQLLKTKEILTPEQFASLIDKNRHYRTGDNEKARRTKYNGRETHENRQGE